MSQRITFFLAIMALTELPAVAELGFNRDIRPILSEKCFACHGFDTKERKGKLRLDILKAAYGKGDSGELAIVPGKTGESLAWESVEADEMPDDRPPLSPSDKKLLKEWMRRSNGFRGITAPSP